MTGSVQLSTLERAAEALNCRLHYVLVPRQPLEAMVRQQAQVRAAATVDAAAHTMRLEDQRPDAEATSAQVETLADELVDRRGLWRTD